MQDVHSVGTFTVEDHVVSVRKSQTASGQVVAAVTHIGKVGEVLKRLEQAANQAVGVCFSAASLGKAVLQSS